jgi:hypothetical protein
VASLLEHATTPTLGLGAPWPLGGLFPLEELCCPREAARYEFTTTKLWFLGIGLLGGLLSQDRHSNRLL